jgi:hypothetical protein
MSAVTSAVSIVVSENSLVRLFCHGQLVGEIIPEVWMMDHAAHLRWYREEGTGRRTDDSDTKSATVFDRGVKMTKHRYIRERRA